jgi:hypothetical protein
MAGLDPAIHAAPLGRSGGMDAQREDVDGRVKPGHDAE